MKSLYIEQHGSIDQLRASDLPQPAPGADETLVQVLASGVNQSDVLSAQGSFPHAALPRTLGRDFAGRVVAGPPQLMGRAVWGSGGADGVGPAQGR